MGRYQIDCELWSASRADFLNEILFGNMNQILKAVLPSIAGEYLSGVDFNTVKASFAGEISMENIALNPALFKKQGLPFLIKYSNIRKLEINVQWLKAKSEPGVVKMSDIHLLLVPSPLSKSDPTEQRIDFLDEITKQCYTKVKSLNNKGESGALSGLKTVIVDNLQVCSLLRRSNCIIELV